MAKTHRRNKSSQQAPAVCEAAEPAAPRDETPAATCETPESPSGAENDRRPDSAEDTPAECDTTADGELFRLQRELEEKERLVAALTERLELAAEQLDRLHRSGADRGMSVGGGVPPELVERQQQLADELQRAVEQWEDLQLSAALGRIEMQIGELRDLIVSRPVIAPPADGHDSTGGGPTDEAAGGNGSHGREQAEPVAETPQSSWEALKARLLSGEEGEASPDGNAPAVGGEETDTVEPESPSSDHQAAAASDVDLTSVEPPAEVDFETATPEDLRQAVIQRDAYIDSLLKKIRSLESQPPVDWAALESAPDDLRERLEQREKQLAECLRLAEVEFSLERARLAREEVRLKQLQEQLARSGREADRTDEAPAETAEAETEQPASENRWKRLLGLKRSQGSD